MAKIEKLKSGTYRIRVYLGKDSSGKKIVKSFTLNSRDSTLGCHYKKCFKAA